jgi:hypothetical protein
MTSFSLPINENMNLGWSRSRAHLANPRTRGLIAVVFIAIGGMSASCGSAPPLEIPVQLKQGVAITVPFSVSSTDAYDIELQFATSRAQRIEIVQVRTLEKLVGTAVISARGKSLSRSLPGTLRSGGADSGLPRIVIARFWADANRPYTLSLRITHLPSELPSKAMIVLSRVAPRFYSDRHIHMLK